MISARKSIEPVFKWPGGKRALVKAISGHCPTEYKRLVEPFCGGAALFFHLQPDSCVLADANGELINAYQQLRDNVETLIEQLGKLQNAADIYYCVRANKPKSPLDRAVRFFYLTRLAFNGIYRENLRGVFNVPYGWKTALSVCNPEHLRVASAKLQDVQIHVQDFRVTMSSIEEGDLVYVDPPYTVAHNNNGFIKYNRNLFAWADQIALAESCRAAVRRGATVVVSNADHDQLHRLYEDFESHQLVRYSSISGLPKGRGAVSEALFVGAAK